MATNPLTYRNNSFYYALTIFGLAVVQVVGLYFWRGYSVGVTAIDASISWLLLGVLIFGIVNTLSYFQPNRAKFLITIAVSVLLAWLYLKLSVWLATYFIQNVEYQSFVRNTELFRYTTSYMMLMSATGLSLLWYQLSETRETQKREQEMEQISKEAELFKLRQQLQPHFLFNSLNSINSLIGSRPEEARGMVHQLSDFLRGTMRREDQKFVTLEEELNYLKLYLDIEQVRFGHRLKVEIGFGKTGTHWLIPPLILQPILENAIKFGLYGTVDNLVIRLDAKEVNNHLELSVSNPYDEDSQPASGTGFGLKSVKRRLHLLFGRTDLLEVEDADNTFVVKIKIPKVYDQGSDNR